jgi:RNA polymerase sigma factor (sigma-70 family)
MPTESELTAKGAIQPLGSQRSDTAAEDEELVARFVQSRDEPAFEALVRRHGSMVLGVCRRILENTQDAEDAFQATFVVLSQKAHSLKKPGQLAGWLYGVAYRLARKAKVRAARRSFHERRAGLNTAVRQPPPADDSRETLALLRRELAHLPMKYRMPLLLCYLQGLTNEQAAQRLGWPGGSMSYRLARGRQMLRDRLYATYSGPNSFLGIMSSVSPC